MKSVLVCAVVLDRFSALFLPSARQPRQAQSARASAAMSITVGR
jgi:hypothetical protein